MTKNTEKKEGIGEILEHPICTTRVLHMGISDHSLAYYNKATYKIKELRTVDNFNADLERAPWVNVNNSSDPNEMWTYWKSKFIAIVDKHELKSVTIRTNNSDHWQNYRKAKNNVNNDIKRVKSLYYNERPRKNSGTNYLQEFEKHLFFSLFLFLSLSFSLPPKQNWKIDIFSGICPHYRGVAASFFGSNKQLHKNMNYLYSIASRFSNNQSS